MGGERLSAQYPWRSLSSVSLALVVVLLVGLMPSVRATNPEPVVASHMDLSVGLGTAKTYDLQTLSVHDYTTVYQPPLNSTGNSTSNQTSANGTWTLIPSPGPVLVTLTSATGATVGAGSVGGIYNLSDGYLVLSFSVTPDFGFDTVTMKVLDFSLNRTATTVFNVVLSETYKYILLGHWFANMSAWVVLNQQQNEGARNTAALVENVGFAFVWIFLILVSLHRIARKHGTLSWWDRVKLGTKATLYVDPTSQALDPEGYNADGVAELRARDIRKESKNLEKLMLSDLREAATIAAMLDLNDDERKFLDETAKSLRAHRGLDPEPKDKRVVQFGGGIAERRPTTLTPLAPPDVVLAGDPSTTPSGSPKEDAKPRRKTSKGAPKEGDAS